MSSEGQDGVATVRVVKRYANRKLYDTVESRYVTLPQVAELVRQGVKVRIIDNNTKDDLTRVTLAQIVYEEERKQSRAQPLTAFKEMLSASGERLITTLRESPVGALITRADSTEEPPPEAPEPPDATPDDKPVEEPREPSGPGRVQQFMEQSREAIDQWQHTVDERVKTLWESINPAAQIQGLQSEVRRLTRRVEALEAERARTQSTETHTEDDRPGE